MAAPLSAVMVMLPDFGTNTPQRTAWNDLYYIVLSAACNIIWLSLSFLKPFKPHWTNTSSSFVKTLQSDTRFPPHGPWISEVSLKPTNVPLLQSLRLQDINSAEIVCILLRDVAPQIMFVVLKPAVMNSNDSLTMYWTFRPLVKHLKALEKLSIALERCVWSTLVRWSWVDIPHWR